MNQHARGFEAIQRGDGDAAALFMRQLIESACEDVLASLDPAARRAAAAGDRPFHSPTKLESADSLA